MNTSGNQAQAILDGKPLVLQTVIPSKIVKEFPEIVSDFRADMEMSLRGFNRRIKVLQAKGEAKFGANNKVKGLEKDSVFLATLNKNKKEEGGEF